MGAKRYQDLDVWGAAFDLTKRVYAETREGAFARDFGMRDQLRRASLSCMSNIAEGFARESDREFIRFLDISRSSAMEVQSILHVAQAEAYITNSLFDVLFELCNKIRAGITALIGYLRRTR